MTFREPLLTPSKRQFQQQPYTDASQATNLELFKNAIPNNNSVWLVPNKQVPSVKGRDYLQNMGMYLNSIPNNNAVLLLVPNKQVPSVKGRDYVQNPGMYANSTPFNQQSWPSTSGVKSSPPQPQPLNILLPLPFNQESWVAAVPVKLVVSDQSNLLNVALLETLPPQSPFYAQDWGTSHILPDWLPPYSQPLNINLFTNPLPFNGGDMSKSSFARPIVSDQDNLPNIVLLYPQVVQVTDPRDPFLTKQFVPTFNRTDPVGTNLPLNSFVAPVAPFAQYQWPQTYVNPSIPADSTLLLFFPPAPFIPLDTSSSRSPTKASDQIYPNIALLNPQGVVASPFSQSDWSKVFDIPSVPTTQYPNIVLQAPAPNPFYTQDFSKTQFVPSVPSPQMGTNVNLFINPLPFNKSDWTYYYPVRLIASDQNTLPNIAGRNPSQPSTALGLFGWTDWNKVKSPVILIPDQDNLPNLVLIINPPTPVVVTPQGGGREGEKKWRWLDHQKDSQQKPIFQDDSVKKAAAVMSSLGGHARAASLTSKQRSTIASKAASIRWK